MNEHAVESSLAALRRRVMAVAHLHRRVALSIGGGRLVWLLGAPLLAVVGLQIAVGLPFYLRALVIPLAAAGLVWLGWKGIVRPLRERYDHARAALLVEAQRPQLSNLLISAIQVSADLERERPDFHPAMVRTLIVHAQHTTQGDDFCQVVDRMPARRHLVGAAAVAAMWVTTLLFAPGQVYLALASFGSAWQEVRDLAQRVAGARIEIDPLSQKAYLVGSDVAIRARQVGFSRPEVEVFVRQQDADQWQRATAQVAADGRFAWDVQKAEQSFELYFVSGVIRSDTVGVIVTEPPRVVELAVETTWPDYVRRAAVVQPRSDGKIEALLGSTVSLQIKASKPLAAARLHVSYLGKPLEMTVAGNYARGVLRLFQDEWLAAEGKQVDATYRIELTDEYGFTNDDADRDYPIAILKDQPPVIELVGLPHRNSGEEPHVLEQNVAGIRVAARVRDDYGVAKVVLHYRIEDLDTDSEKSKGDVPRVFALPRAELPHLPLVRLGDLDAHVGDRIVVWAEAVDSYDLDEKTGANQSRTPAYRLAVVSEEELFGEVVYSDDWSTQWYDSLKMATLGARKIPERTAAEREDAATVAKKLLATPPANDRLGGEDQQLVQDYFSSLNETGP